MRISNNQISLMKYLNMKGMIYRDQLSNEQKSVADYLVHRKFAELSYDIDREYYRLLQEGEAYLYEYKDMMKQRYFATGFSISAFIISVVSLIVNIFD